MGADRRGVLGLGGREGTGGQGSGLELVLHSCGRRDSMMTQVPKDFPGALLPLTTQVGRSLFFLQDMWGSALSRP